MKKIRIFLVTMCFMLFAMGTAFADETEEKYVSVTFEVGEDAEIYVTEEGYKKGSVTVTGSAFEVDGKLYTTLEELEEKIDYYPNRKFFEFKNWELNGKECERDTQILDESTLNAVWEEEEWKEFYVNSNLGWSTNKPAEELVNVNKDTIKEEKLEKEYTLEEIDKILEENTSNIKLHRPEDAVKTIQFKLTSDFIKNEDTIKIKKYSDSDEVNFKKTVGVIHIKPDGTIEIIGVDSVEFESHGVGIYILVNVEGTADIIINKEEKDYILAYTYDEEKYGRENKTYFPVGEKISLPIGTEIYVDTLIYTQDFGYKTTILVNGEEVDYNQFKLLKDSEVSLKYEKYQENDSEKKYNPYILLREHTWEDSKDGSGSGKLAARIYENGKWIYAADVTYSLEKVEYYKEGEGYKVLEDESFMLNGDLLTSKSGILAGGYKIFINFTINGTTMQDDIYLEVGKQIYISAYFGKYNYNENTHIYSEALSEYLWEDDYSYKDKTLASIKAELGDKYYEPKMYGGYNFAGWYTFEGEKISEDTILEDDMIYGRFEKDGKLYEINYSFGEVDGDNSKPDDNNSGSNNNNNNNSNSGNQSNSNKSEENTVVNDNTLGSYNLSNTEKYSISKNVSNILGKDVQITSIIKNEAGIMAISTIGDIVLQKNNGNMAQKEWALIDGSWYYFGEDKKAASGWVQNETGKWYYLNTADKKMETGWLQTADGNWYYLDNSNGDMKTGWQQTTDGNWYFMNRATGSMMTGWIWVEQKYYYLGESGACAINSMTPDGYHVDENGVWLP